MRPRIYNLSITAVAIRHPTHHLNQIGCDFFVGKSNRRFRNAITKPPAIAPSGLPTPPTIAAAKGGKANAYKQAAYSFYQDRITCQQSSPRQPLDRVIRTTRSGSMPDSRAKSSLSENARIDFVRVYLKPKTTPTTANAVRAITPCEVFSQPSASPVLALNACFHNEAFTIAKITVFGIIKRIRPPIINIVPIDTIGQITRLARCCR